MLPPFHSTPHSLCIQVLRPLLHIVCHSKPSTIDRITFLPDLSLSKQTTHHLQIHTFSLLAFCESPAKILQIHVDSALCFNLVVKWLVTFGSPHIFKSLLLQCITIPRFTFLLSVCFYEHLDFALCLDFLVKGLLDFVRPPNFRGGCFNHRTVIQVILCSLSLSLVL